MPVEWHWHAEEHARDLPVKLRPSPVIDRHPSQFMFHNRLLVLPSSLYGPRLANSDALFMSHICCDLFSVFLLISCGPPHVLWRGSDAHSKPCVPCAAWMIGWGSRRGVFEIVCHSSGSLPIFCVSFPIASDQSGRNFRSCYDRIVFISRW